MSLWRDVPLKLSDYINNYSSRVRGVQRARSRAAQGDRAVRRRRQEAGGFRRCPERQKRERVAPSSWYSGRRPDFRPSGVLSAFSRASTVRW